MYQIKQVTIPIEELQVKLQRVTNVSELMDEFIDREAKGMETDERFPYWADLWHAAITMSKYLVKNRIIKAGTKVTEIGCGLGLTGVVAGMMGGQVTFTDYFEEALVVAKKNWDLNCTHTAQFRWMDWRSPNQGYAGEVILAADVAYDADNFAPVLNTFNKLCLPGGCIIFGEPNRKITQPFLEQLKQENFNLEKMTYQEPHDQYTATVNIFKLTKF